MQALIARLMNGDLDVMQPNKHGISHLSVSGPILVQIAEGSWNMPTAQEYGEEIKALVSTQMPSHWVLFVDLRTWEFCPPEVWEYFDGLYQWLAEHGMIGQAILCKKQMMKHFVMGLDERAGSPLPFGQFITDDYDEAYRWCENQIAS